MLIVKVRRVGCQQALEAQVVALEHLPWELPTLVPGICYCADLLLQMLQIHIGILLQKLPLI